MHVLLFAESGKDAGLATLLVMFGGAVVWLTTYLAQRRKDRRKDAREDEDNAIARLQALLDRVDKDRLESKAEAEKLARELRAMQIELLRVNVKAERAIAWIRHLEAALSNNDIAYRPWTEEPTGDSATHAPLSPEPKK